MRGSLQFQGITFCWLPVAIEPKCCLRRHKMKIELMPRSPCGSVCPKKIWWARRTETKTLSAMATKLSFGYARYGLAPSPRFDYKIQRLRSKAGFDKESLTLDELGKWEEAAKHLVELGFTAGETDTILGKAFGWIKSPYWGEEMEKTMPRSDMVLSAITFLKELGLAQTEVSSVIKKFPELLGCEVETSIRNNVEILDSTWGISGKTLKNLISRRPQVLGYNVDCKGDCMAQCTRCWVRF